LLQHGRYFSRADGDHVDEVAHSVGARPPEIAVVDDDATTDMAMATEAGALGIQVRTGKYAAQVTGGVRSEAQHVIASVADLPGFLG
jgi:ribonucleotide monophosphatase NagD (HAD superfamily)